MPRASSTVIVDQTFPPLCSSHSPGLYSSLNFSPGFGTTWKLHTNFPVWTSQARISLRGCGGDASPGRADVIARLCQIVTGLGIAQVLRRDSPILGVTTPI